jgi:hypothetical protein
MPSSIQETSPSPPPPSRSCLASRTQPKLRVQLPNSPRWAMAWGTRTHLLSRRHQPRNYPHTRELPPRSAVPRASQQNISVGVVALVILNLFDVFCSSMMREGDGGHATRSTWEYVAPDGSPGIGLYTSLNHPWGSTPTYVLSSCVLGIRPVLPGYTTWFSSRRLCERLAWRASRGGYRRRGESLE